MSDPTPDSVADIEGAIASAIDRRDLRLHLGSGKRLLPGWINIDGHPRAGVLRLDLPEGLARFPDACASYIYSSHFLEHLEYPAAASALAGECHRILMPGGVLRLVVPGIEKIIRAYVDDDAGFFAIQAGLHPAWCTTRLEHLMYALQQDGEHKYGYDFETLRKLLSGAGFGEIIESDCNSSGFEELRIDYRALRDNHGRALSLYADAVKLID